LFGRDFKDSILQTQMQNKHNAPLVQCLKTGIGGVDLYVGSLTMTR